MTMQRIQLLTLQRSNRKRGVKPMTLFVTLVAIVFSLLVLGWFGLQVRPAPFPSYAEVALVPETVPLRQDLPAPVERFYQQIYGDEVPVVGTAVISGRARLRFKGVTLLSRFRFTHEAGQSYRHYIESTLFGLPVMKINETFLEGQSRLELPFGVTENEPKVDQAANLGLWAEGIWFPGVFLTDARVRWEAVDDTTALLIVPFEDTEERFTVRFDPETRLVTMFEAMRYHEADSLAKTLWISEVLEWGEVSDYMLPVRTSLTWLDEGRPWAVWTVEEVVYNADVETYVRARGL